MKATKFTIGRKLFLLSLIPIAVMIAAALVVSSMLFDGKIRQDARKVTKQAADNTAAFSGGAEQFDDVTMVLLSVDDVLEYTLEPPSFDDITRICDGVSEILRRRGADADAVSETCIVIDELINNYVSYGFEGVENPRLGLTASFGNGELRVTVRDNGTPFDVTAFAPAPVSGTDASEVPGGVGISLVRDLCETIRYEAGNGEGGLNVLSFLKHTDRSVSGSRDAGGTAED